MPWALAFALVLGLGIGTGPVAAQSAPQSAALLNDYPTEARADYVFGCMAANGQTQEMLRLCSCSIDIIAEILPYDDYVSAEAVLRLAQLKSERTSILRNAPVAKLAVEQLRRAQAEAEILCFE